MKHWILAFLLVAFATPASCKIIKRAPAKPIVRPWNDLICTDEDRANIYEIISTVGEKSKLALLFYQSYLREKGAQITHVHPLKFLAVIFSDAHLKICMYYIWDDYFKRSSFIGDLSDALNREADRDKIYPYLTDFANEVGKPIETVKSYVDVRDWNNMIIFLLQP